VDTETAAAKGPVKDPEEVIKLEQDNMKNAEIIGLRSRKHAKIFEEM